HLVTCVLGARPPNRIRARARHGALRVCRQRRGGGGGGGSGRGGAAGSDGGGERVAPGRRAERPSCHNGDPARVGRHCGQRVHRAAAGCDGESHRHAGGWITDLILHHHGGGDGDGGSQGSRLRVSGVNRKV